MNESTVYPEKTVLGLVLLVVFLFCVVVFQSLELTPGKQNQAFADGYETAIKQVKTAAVKCHDDNEKAIDAAKTDAEFKAAFDTSNQRCDAITQFYFAHQYGEIDLPQYAHPAL